MPLSIQMDHPPICSLSSLPGLDCHFAPRFEPDEITAYFMLQSEKFIIILDIDKVFSEDELAAVQAMESDAPLDTSQATDDTEATETVTKQASL